MERYKLQKELVTLTPKQICWFALRCALRSMPVLTWNDERFLYWGNYARKYIFAVFRACNMSISLSVAVGVHAIFSAETKSSYFSATAADVAEAATATAAVEATATAAVEATANAAAAAVYAAAAINAADFLYNSIGDPYAAAVCLSAQTFAYDPDKAAYFAANAAAAANAAYFAANAADTTVISTDTTFVSAANADISFLKTITKSISWPDLWHGNSPVKWLKWENSFLSGLRLLNLCYWADEYCNWVQGQFDRKRLELCHFMPRATIDAGPATMLVYLHAEELVRMAEVRVIFLGDGKAGKTSLIRRLLGMNIRGDEPATPRVEIRHRRETINGEDIRVHYWDFGGQVIMHATHQFFLRDKSVYVIVLDICTRCDCLEYWLDHVRVFAPNAPTFIVLNKVDSLPSGMASHPLFDINEIRRRYPFVEKKVYQLSCKTKGGTDDFAEALKAQITRNHVIKRDMPVQWFKVKEALARENQNYIGLKRFDEICREQGIPDKEIEPVLTVLDNMGLAIHFPELRETRVVLNPEWITKAVYYIIWASEKLGLNGKLSVRDVKTLFAKERDIKKLGVEVPEEMCGFLLGLLTQFKLAFEIKTEKEKYYVPMLTPVLEPNHGIEREGGLRFRFDLPFLPPGLYYRFIAESGDELVDDWIWKTGAILSDGNSRVLVEYNEYQRAITFYAHGQNPGIYLTTLRQRFMLILEESYKKLDYEPYVVTPEDEQINWRDMLVRYGKEGKTAKAYTGRFEYDIRELLEQQFGDITDTLQQILNKEWSVMNKHISKNISIISATDNSVVIVDQTATVSEAVSALMYLLPIDSDLKKIKKLIIDFREYHKEQAEKHKEDLRKFEMEIDGLRSAITELGTVTDVSPTAEAKRKTILGRFKERWDKLAEMSEQCYYVSGIAEKIIKIGGLIAKIAWPTIL